MQTYVNRRALGVQVVLAIILAGVNLKSSTTPQIVAWVAGFLLVTTGLNVLITWSRHRTKPDG